MDSGEVEEEEEECSSVDASHQKEADYVAKPEFEIENTPSYEDPTDPFWRPEGEEYESTEHEADPIELRPPRREAPDIPTRRSRGPIGFLPARKVTRSK